MLGGSRGCHISATRLRRPANLGSHFEDESGQLRLSPEFKSFLEPFVPKTANHVTVEPLSA
jgi:hypothetical protein